MIVGQRLASCCGLVGRSTRISQILEFRRGFGTLILDSFGYRAFCWSVERYEEGRLSLREGVVS